MEEERREGGVEEERREGGVEEERREGGVEEERKERGRNGGREEGEEEVEGKEEMVIGVLHLGRKSCNGRW